MAERDIVEKQKLHEARHLHPHTSHLQALIRVSQIIPQGTEVGDPISGGYASQVFEGFFNGRPVIIKHTEDLENPGSNLILSRKAIETGIKVISLLQEVAEIRVPNVIAYDPEIATMVMEDLREDGYVHTPKYVRENHSLPAESARKAGLAFGHLVRESRSWGPELPTRTAMEDILLTTRGIVATYGPNSFYEIRIIQRFIQNQGWVWWDSTPNNTLVKGDGKTAFIDFDSSCWGDRQITLPMFLSHIIIYGLTGHMDRSDAIEYIRNCVQAFREVESLDESAFCQYAAMEILGNSKGQFTQVGVGDSQTSVLESFAKKVLETNMDRIDDLIDLMSTTK